MADVKVKFTGTVAKKVKVSEIKLEVDEDLKKALDTIREEVIRLAGGELLFAVLLNGTNCALAINSDIKVNQGDTFEVVPAIVGG